MGLNSVVPCIACGVHTSNPHCFCSDECWDGYHDRDLYDADVLADMMDDAEFDEFAEHVWADDGGNFADIEARLMDEFDEDGIPW